MKSFFQNKANILLSLVLIVILGIAGFLLFNYLSPENVKAIDYSQLAKSEIEEWFKEKDLSDALDFEYEYLSVHKGRG